MMGHGHSKGRWTPEGSEWVLRRGASTAPSARLTHDEVTALLAHWVSDEIVPGEDAQPEDGPITARWIAWGTEVKPDESLTVEVAYDADAVLLVDGEPVVPTRAGRGGQPLPTEGAVCVQDAWVEHWSTEDAHRALKADLIAYTAERKALGVKRYGRALETHNGRDALTDAFEEAFDLCMYLGQLQLERGGTLSDDPYPEDVGRADTLGVALDIAQEVLHTLGSTLVGRDGKLPEVVE